MLIRGYYTISSASVSLEIGPRNMHFKHMHQEILKQIELENYCAVGGTCKSAPPWSGDSHFTSQKPLFVGK